MDPIVYGSSVKPAARRKLNRFADRIELATYYNGGFDSDDGFGYEVVLRSGFVVEGYGTHAIIATDLKTLVEKLERVIPEAA